MRLATNIKEVIRRTEALKSDIPIAIAMALRPGEWLEQARETAEGTLQALATAENSKHVAAFVATVVALVLSGGFELRMHAPGGELKNSLRKAQEAASLKPTMGGPQFGLFERSVTDFEELILEWVSTPEEQGGKRRDSRDAGKSDEDIARLISYIMLAPSPEPGGMLEKARKGLTRHIQAFINQQGGSGADAETADMWLRAVLKAWRSMVVNGVMPKIRHHLNARRLA